MKLIFLALLAACIFAGCRTPAFVRSTMDTLQDNRFYTIAKRDIKATEDALSQDYRDISGTADRKADSAVAKTDSAVSQAAQSASDTTNQVADKVKSAFTAEKKS